MKDRILANWDTMRWLRLAFAVIFLFAAIDGHEPVAYMAAAFFGMQALFNIGCCGAACSTPKQTSASLSARTTTDVIFEEIK